MSGELSPLKTFVVVGPLGLAYVGLHTSEDDCWTVCLGWPSSEEIEAYKADGWYCAEANITWQKPKGE